MTNAFQIEAIAEMSKAEAGQSRVVAAVLTKIGELAEKNPDLAALEGDRAPNSRSHNFVPGGGLDDTQTLGLRVIKSQGLMSKIPLTMEQAEAFVQDVHARIDKEMATGRVVLNSIEKYAAQPEELTRSPTVVDALNRIGTMAENNGGWKDYAKQDPRLDPSKSDHNRPGNDLHQLTDTQRLGLLVIQNEFAGPGQKLTPEQQQVIEEIGHQYLISHPASPGSPKAGLRQDGGSEDAMHGRLNGQHSPQTGSELSSTHQQPSSANAALRQVIEQLRAAVPGGIEDRAHDGSAAVTGNNLQRNTASAKVTGV